MSNTKITELVEAGHVSLKNLRGFLFIKGYGLQDSMQERAKNGTKFTTVVHPDGMCSILWMTNPEGKRTEIHSNDGTKIGLLDHHGKLVTNIEFSGSLGGVTTGDPIKVGTKHSKLPIHVMKEQIYEYKSDRMRKKFFRDQKMQLQQTEEQKRFLEQHPDWIDLLDPIDHKAALKAQNIIKIHDAAMESVKYADRSYYSEVTELTKSAESVGEYRKDLNRLIRKAMSIIRQRAKNTVAHAVLELAAAGYVDLAEELIDIV